LKNYTISVLGILLAVVLVAGCSGSGSKANSNVPDYYDEKLVKEYKVVEEKDISLSNIKRMSYRIVVPATITEAELKSTMIKLSLDKTTTDPDLDEVTIFAYDNEKDAFGPYTKSMLEWCPNGNWGDITNEIASSNDRSTYKYNIVIK
jgi:hypothetical protein